MAAVAQRRRVLLRRGGTAAAHAERRLSAPWGGRAARKDAADTVALARLHKLLILGSPVLEPDFHLKCGEKKISQVKNKMLKMKLKKT